MRKIVLISAILLAVCLTNAAHASEAEDLAAGIQCMPAKDIVKIVRKFDRIKPEKKDSVMAVPTMQLSAEEGGELPERVYFRTGTAEVDFHMDKDGNVTDFARIGSMSKKGEMCMYGKQFINVKEDDTDIDVSIDFDVIYKNMSGLHSLAELRDGLKDGKSHIKKMVPGPFKLLIPKFTHLAIEHKVESKTQKPLQIAATKAGQEVPGLKVEPFEGAFIVRVEDLAEIGADGLKVSGGAYKITPIPSIEKMKEMSEAEGEDEGDR